jgi:hypothetical protein
VQKLKSLSPAVLAALLSCGTATPLRAIQTEPSKQAETKPAAKPAEAQPAEAKPAAEKSADGKAAGGDAAAACVPGPGVTCGETAGGPDLELGLDKTLPPVSYDEAMSMDLGPMPWIRIRQFHRLHQDLEKKVKMSTEQRELLRARFQQIYATIIKHNRRCGWRGFNYPPLTPEERSALEGELAQAEINKDTAKAESLRTRILQGTFGTDLNRAAPIDLLIIAMKDKMDADQQPVFQQAYDRWYGLETRGPMDVPTRILIRSLKDPDIQLDPAFVGKAESKIKEKVDSLPAPPERRHHLAKAAEELKAEILAELPPEKRAAVERTFDSLMAEREAVEKYTKEHLIEEGSRSH